MRATEAEPSSEVPSKIAGVPSLEPRSGKSDLDLRGDTKTVYRQLADAFGVKVVFDPDVTVRNVRLRVGDVDFNIAVSILGAQTGTFWQPLNAKLMLVAPDTPEKHHLYAIEVEKVFPLKAGASPDEMTETLRTLRDIMGAMHLNLDSRSGTITMRDTPERLSIADELIQELDEPRGEVILEMELLDVDRKKARQLGITTPSSAQLIPLSSSDLAKLKSSTDLASLLTNVSQILGARGIGNDASVVPIGGGVSTFLLTVPGTTANFSDSRSMVESGQRVLLRAQDGKPATFFVGNRYPVSLAQLSASAGGNGSTAVPPGTSFPETSFPVGKNPSAVVAGTFTGGTLPDLAVTNRDDDTISILENQDNGDFVKTSTSPITLGKNEVSPVAIASAIFRSDSSKFSSAQPADLVVVNSSSNNISVLLGDSDSSGRANGGFTEAPGSPKAVGTNPSAVAVADFNGDGFLDVAVANQGDSSISVFRGNGDGTFTEFPASPFRLTNTSSVSEKGPIAMVSANFQNQTLNLTNGAAEVDLAIVNEASNNVTILLGSIDENQNVTFREAPSSPIAVGNSPVAIASGDLNADGVSDLAVVNQGDNSVTVLLGSSNLDATFSAAQGSPLQTAATPAGILIANFRNGSVPDIAVTNEGVGTLGVYLGQGQGTFSSRIELNLPKGPTALIASILTSSGLPDVALVAQDPTANTGVVAIIQDSSSFANSSGNSSVTPYPSGEYLDLGVKVKATPKLHAGHEVTLQLEFEIRGLSGNTLNGIPIISNATLSQTVRLKEDEPAILGGLAALEKTRALSGLPGLAQIPGGVGYAFGTTNNSARDSELLIVVTPRRLRSMDRTSRPVFAGRGEPGAATEHVLGQPPQPPPGAAQPKP